MVSTRHHPSDFPTSRSTASPSPPATTSTSPFPPHPWTHTPSHLTLLWLSVSLPLVVWDTFYVLLRPHSMPGGALHSPVWAPYKLYGQVDYMYGWPAWEARNGFTAAQAWLNLAETGGYALYLWVVLRRGGEGGGRVEGRGAPGGVVGRWVGEGRVVRGREAAGVVLLGFAVGVMTVSKTVLYWLNEYFSGFDNIGHNSWSALLFLWIIPNGAWLVFPSYMIYVFGQEILQGLEIASGEFKAAKDR